MYIVNVQTIEAEEDTFAYVPEGEVSSVMQQFKKAEEEARAERAREKLQRTSRYSYKPKYGNFDIIDHFSRSLSALPNSPARHNMLC